MPDSSIQVGFALIFGGFSGKDLDWNLRVNMLCKSFPTWEELQFFLKESWERIWMRIREIFYFNFCKIWLPINVFCRLLTIVKKALENRLKIDICHFFHHWCYCSSRGVYCQLLSRYLQLSSFKDWEIRFFCLASRVI